METEWPLIAEPLVDVGDGKKLISVTVVEEPTCMLRWVPLSIMQAHEHKLQQAWKITTLHDGKPVAINHDWRDVPFEPNP